MRAVYDNIGMYKKWATSLKEHVHQTHEEGKIEAKMVSALLSHIPGDKLASSDDIDVVVL